MTSKNEGDNCQSRGSQTITINFMMSSNQAFPKVKGPYEYTELFRICFNPLEGSLLKGHKLFLSPRQGNLSLCNFDYLSG